MNDRDFYSFVDNKSTFDKELEMAAIVSLTSFMNVMNHGVSREKMDQHQGTEFLHDALKKFELIMEYRLTSISTKIMQEIENDFREGKYI